MDEHVTDLKQRWEKFCETEDEAVVPTDAESAARYAKEIQEATQQLEEARAGQRKADTREIHIAYESYINTLQTKVADTQEALAMLIAKPPPAPPREPERVWHLDDDDWADVRLLLDNKNLPEELTSLPGWGLTGSIEAREWVQAHPQAVLFQGHIYDNGPPPITLPQPPDAAELAWEIHRQIMRHKEDEIDRRHRFNDTLIIWTVASVGFTAIAGVVAVVVENASRFFGF